ncbi:MAG: xylose isomerase [Flavobacteriaceae bacterium]|nr:xylose isomerase [Flavobacteriaceae bacterium]
MDRRNFSKLILSSSLTGFFPNANFPSSFESNNSLKISLAQWSLNKSIKSGKLSPLDFAKKARSFGIDAIEHVSTLYTRHSDVTKKMPMYKLAKELVMRADDFGIENFLIMIDGQGNLASSNRPSRLSAIDKHKRWIDFAVSIGCKTLRLNLNGSKRLDKWTSNSIKSLFSLSNYNKNINIVVENHGGFSSNGKYLANVMSNVNLSNCGTLPDFGNFCLDGWPSNCGDWYDKYTGMEELMPHALAVSAKSYHFDSIGNETTIDFSRMIDIVKKARYSGYIGIEYEGEVLSEDEGIIATKQLLEKLIK